MKYKNLTLFITGILLALLLAQSDDFHDFLLRLGEIGYLGAFVGGLFFVLTFTVGTGALILITLADAVPLLPLALVAAMGAVIGDFMIFSYVQDNLRKELGTLSGPLKNWPLAKIWTSKYSRWTLPLIGALIIASPLPDEIGVSLMGLSKIKPANFILLSFILNSIGIFLIVSAAALLKN